MRIYSMTATFGKLEHQTLTLEPGLNVIQAPNEWGKSTWCSFLTAMIYGLDTRARSTATALSDKERYTPWSGVPMAGRMDLNWNGRDITIERKTKGRSVFGDFRAYETASGLPVPELTAQNCGQLLLGVEKTVFTRSAMIRLTDLPVTQDEALRRRLNSLVTTGDDSDTGDQLEKKLRDLKNRCRYNRTGLLPQAEAEAADLEQKLRELETLESQSRSLRQRCSDLEDRIRKLENHRTALRYEAARENAQRLENAETQLLLAAQDCRDLEDKCRDLPARETVKQSLDRLQDLQYRWTQLQMDPVLPNPTLDHPVFRGTDPKEVQKKVAEDTAAFQSLTGWNPLPLSAAILAILIGIGCTFLLPQYRLYAFAALACGGVTLLVWLILLLSNREKAKKLASFYRSSDPKRWASMAEEYAHRVEETAQNQTRRQSEAAVLQEQTLALCQNRTPSEAMQYWQGALDLWEALEDAQREVYHRREHRDTLRSLTVTAPAPTQPDQLNLSDAQTGQLLVESVRELRENQHRLGQCQGQMEAIGYRTALEMQRNALKDRIRQLEDTYAALSLALETLESARSSLQRRFAPRITGRAQDLLSRLTDGRYDRLVLGADLTLHATARDEDTLRTSLWRSDGTADLLYLALRLAVAAELIPDAPLILDDALIRFDDKRLSQTMTVLKEESEHRQIILFTCHSRESQYV